MVRDEMDVFVFHFDVIGVRAMLVRDMAGTLEQLEEFQRVVRERCDVAVPDGTLITLADNVWARIPATEPEAVVEILAETLNAFGDSGFSSYFCAITRGTYAPAFGDGALVAGGNPSQIQKQHIGMTSDPHLRAAMAEKWSAALARSHSLPAPAPCVWLSEEVPPSLFASLRGLAFGPPFDLRRLPIDKQNWPFARGRFVPARPAT